MEWTPRGMIGEEDGDMVMEDSQSESSLKRRKMMAKVTGEDMGSQTFFVGRGLPMGGLDGTIWWFTRPMMPTLCATNLDDHPKFKLWGPSKMNPPFIHIARPH